MVDMFPAPTGNEDTTTILLVHYKPAVRCGVQREATSHVSREDDFRLSDTWQNLVTLPQEYSTYPQPMLEMLAHFAYMWEGHLGRIKAPRHRTELTSPKSRPIRSVTYRAGPKSRVSEKELLYNMIEMSVLEHAHNEWTAPIRFSAKNDGTL